MKELITEEGATLDTSERLTAEGFHKTGEVVRMPEGSVRGNSPQRFHRVTAGRLQGDRGGAMPVPNTDSTLTSVTHPSCTTTRSTHQCLIFSQPVVTGHCKHIEAVPAIVLEG